MKIVGSAIEDQYIAELLNGNRALFNSSDRKPLLNALKKAFPKMRTAYVLDWVPEQGEDIYYILIDSNYVAQFEVSRLESNAVRIVKYCTVKEYLKRLRKHRLLKLLLALRLASEG